MKPMTVIIPTWNFGKYLPELYDSIVCTAFNTIIEEVIFVCDKSEDNSEEVINNIIVRETNRGNRVRLIVPRQRKGLFYARYEGAIAAKTEKIMFIDSRITLPKATGAALPQLVDEYPAMSCNVDIDINKNIFCLYWQRSHEAVFARTYRENNDLIEVNASNFDDYRIGGTSFYCSRDLFVEVSKKYLRSGLKSDDTYVMRDMVKTQAFYVHPAYRIQWEPRDQWQSFLKHLYHRGPGFAEYHIFEHRSWLFYAVAMGFVGLIATLALLFVQPIVALLVISFSLLLMALSTFLIAKDVFEALKLMPLHIGVLLAYGLGAVRGTWKTYLRRRKLFSQLSKENDSTS